MIGCLFAPDSTLELAQKKGAACADVGSSSAPEADRVEQSKNDGCGRRAVNAYRPSSPLDQVALAALSSPVYRMAGDRSWPLSAHGGRYPAGARASSTADARCATTGARKSTVPSRPARERRPDHDSYDDLATYLERQNRYTTLAARQAFEQGRSAGVFHLLCSPVVRFIKFYLMRLGFLDGLPGLLHISVGCMNSYMKYAKLIELRRAESR